MISLTAYRKAESAVPLEHMTRFTYVYILQSEADPDHFYIGRTQDLRARILRHNSGQVPQHIQMETMANQDICGAFRREPSARL